MYQVATPNEEEYEKIKLISTKSESNSPIISRSYDQKVYLLTTYKHVYSVCTSVSSNMK